MSVLLAEIQEAVRKSLPAHLSEELRSLLTKAERDAKAVELLNSAALADKKAIDFLSAENNSLRLAASAVQLRETSAIARESALKVREDKIAVLELEVKLRTEFNGTLREVVRDVFSNNRFKYDESVPVAVPGGGGSCGHVQTHTRSVSGEGAVPPGV